MTQQINRKRQYHCVEGNNGYFFEPKSKRRRIFNNQLEVNFPIENLVQSVTTQIKNLNEQFNNLLIKMNHFDKKIDNLNNRVNKIEKILKENYIRELPKFSEPCSYIS